MKTREEIEEAISALVIDACAHRQYANKLCPQERAIALHEGDKSALAAGALMWILGATDVGAPDMRQYFDRRLAEIVHDFAQASGPVNGCCGGGH